MTQTTPYRVLLVTGLSGAGKSTALDVLEDLGYETVDNVPVRLIENLITPDNRSGHNCGLAIGLDTRTQGFSGESGVALFNRLHENSALEVGVVFLACDDEVLERRFTETRRRHPLATDRPVADGIRQEQAILYPMKQQATDLIDTTNLSVRDFKDLMQGRFAMADRRDMSVAVMSFSYRQGVPREADLVFDVRFLKNPHYVPELKSGTGQDKAVAEHIMTDPSFSDFDSTLRALLKTLLPGYVREGKSYLTLAFGCTGGQHRSVFMAERFSNALSAGEITGESLAVTLRHRELARLDLGAVRQKREKTPSE